jgi:hypothetical protein
MHHLIIYLFNLRVLLDILNLLPNYFLLDIEPEHEKPNKMLLPLIRVKVDVEFGRNTERETEFVEDIVVLFDALHKIFGYFESYLTFKILK